MFELNGVKFGFDRVLVADALRIQSITTESNKDISPQRESELENEMMDIAFKYLIVYLKEGNSEKVVKCGGEMMQNLKGQDPKDYIADIFGNPFYMNEIVARFGEAIAGFLQSLPISKERAKESTGGKRDLSKG